MILGKSIDRKPVGRNWINYLFWDICKSRQNTSIKLLNWRRRHLELPSKYHFEAFHRIGIPIYILHCSAELLIMLRGTYNKHRFRIPFILCISSRWKRLCLFIDDWSTMWFGIRYSFLCFELDSGIVSDISDVHDPSLRTVLQLALFPPTLLSTFFFAQNIMESTSSNCNNYWHFVTLSLKATFCSIMKQLRRKLSNKIIKNK